MFVRVGCELVLETDAPTPISCIVRPRDRYWHVLVDERREIEPGIPVYEFLDSFGNHVWRWTAPAGVMRLRYDALAKLPAEPDPVLADLPGTLVQDLPGEVLMYTLPSRHCQSDLVVDEAWRMFGDVQPGWARVQAICDWIHTNVEYGYGNSTSTTTGYEAYQNRRGVCRDFAHIAVMFCRAMNIPARYVCGYLPDIGVPYNPIPMDFHAWFEAYIDGAWRTFDARHNVPRIGRVLIAQGRDAVDTAILTSYGPSRLVSMTVWADEVPLTTTLDDPLTTTALDVAPRQLDTMTAAATWGEAPKQREVHG